MQQHIPTDTTKEREWLANAIKTCPEVKEAVEDFDRECDFRGKLVAARESTTLTAEELQQHTRLNKRIIRKIEIDKELNLSLPVFMKYLAGLGYELDIVKRTTI